MNTTTSLTSRDRAVLKAVAAGRCAATGSRASTLTIDGLCCADQFVGPRLIDAGLIAVQSDARAEGRRLARLTDSGLALLLAA